MSPGSAVELATTLLYEAVTGRHAVAHFELQCQALPMTQRVGVKAIAVIRRPSDGALLVGETSDPATGVVFHRGVGGHVEFGERAADTITRELMEELGEVVRVGRLLGVLENLFEFDGQPGHEIVFLYETEFADASAYKRDRFDFMDRLDAPVTLPAVFWRTAVAGEPPLYPAGIDELLSL